jgi:hypothetical protein
MCELLWSIDSGDHRKIMARLHSLIPVLLLTAAGFSQAADPEAPTPKAEQHHAQHRFFDLVNDSSIAAAAVPIIGDSLSTQRFLGVGTIHEGNPIARPFVNTRSGQAFISSVGFGSLVGAMYVLHRLEGRAGEAHRRKRVLYSWLERASPVIVSSVEFNRWHHNEVLIQRCTSLTSDCK